MWTQHGHWAGWDEMHMGECGLNVDTGLGGMRWRSGLTMDTWLGGMRLVSVDSTWGWMG